MRARQVPRNDVVERSEANNFSESLAPKSKNRAQHEIFKTCDISSASEKAFLGVFGGFFCCRTPSKKGVF